MDEVTLYIAGGLSAAIHALAAFGYWMIRGRIADLKAENKQADERAERLRQALDECYKSRSEVSGAHD